jgi:putative ATPase
LPVPAALQDKHYAGAERLGRGDDYQYAHDHPGNFVPQDHLGAERRYYEPGETGVEKKIKDRLEQWRALRAQARTREAKSS